MALIEAATRTIHLKIVYYGCAKGGKTTNLISLHRLTDPEGSHRLVSIATDDDRTLFFDLLPMNLGQIGGMTVKAKVYTVPGQVHYELTRRRVLAGADGVVLVVDSSPATEKDNIWSQQNLRTNLRANSLDPDTTPTVLQWNKRDLPDARRTEDLNAQLNTAGLPAVQGIATKGSGVVEAFSEVLVLSIASAYRKAGQTDVDANKIRATVEQALQQAKLRAPSLEPSDRSGFEHRFDMSGYRDDQAKEGHNRQVVDESTLLSEAVHTNMMLAEKLDGLEDDARMSRRRGLMMQALGKVAPLLADPSGDFLPEGAMQHLLKGCMRRQGSVLFFKSNADTMEEKEVVPAGRDPLNQAEIQSLGSVAYRVCQEPRFRVLTDIGNDVFYGDPPPLCQGLGAVLLAPLRCDGMAFGSMIVYSQVSESGFDRAEQEYWHTASTLLSLSIHWRLVRKKLAMAGGGAPTPETPPRARA